MRSDLSVRAVHLGDMRIDVRVREHVLPMDYPAVQGKNPTPLEVLLASLAACAGNTLSLVLRRKMGAKVDSLEIEARAERREEHPTVLTAIELAYHLRGEALSADEVSGPCALPKTNSVRCWPCCGRNRDSLHLADGLNRSGLRFRGRKWRRRPRTGSRRCPGI